MFQEGFEGMKRGIGHRGDTGARLRGVPHFLTKWKSLDNKQHGLENASSFENHSRDFVGPPLSWPRMKPKVSQM